MLRQESQPWSFVLFIGHVQGLLITWMWLLVSSPKYFCSYCVYFDICPSTTQSVCFDTYSIVIVLTSGPAGGWINTSVSCLVKLPLLFLAMGTLTLVSLVLFTTIVLTGGQKWSFYEWKFIQTVVLRTLLTSIKHNTNKQMYLQYYKLVHYHCVLVGRYPKGGGSHGQWSSLHLVWWWIIYSISYTVISITEAHL